MPGPPPKPDAQRRRRNAVVAMTRLPARFDGPKPAWPLPGKPSKAEADTWSQLWTLPQAAAWSQSQSTRVVARYVRILVMAEWGGEKAWPEVRMLEDRLGLTPMSMLRLRWEVAADEVEEKRATRAPARKRTPPKRRLMAVDGSKAG